MLNSLKPVALVACLACLAVAPLRETPESIFARINTEVLSGSRAYETLEEATRTIGHRLTGSKNGYQAETYAHDLLAGYGLEVRYQPFEVEAWSRDTATLSVAPEKSDNFQEIRTIALAHSPVFAHTNARLIDVGNGLEADFEAKKEEIVGKIVIANLGLVNAPVGSKNLHRSEKTALAIHYGAEGIIMVSTQPGGVLLTGTASVTGSLIPIPAVCVSLESGKMLREWLETEKLLAFIDMKNRSEIVKCRNVVATIKGKSKEKIVIGGHLDSWDLGTGAIDNGLGSFAVLDIARTFHALKLQPRRTIEFVVFMGEEQGLLGSKAYVEAAQKDGTFKNIKYMINLDMTHAPTGVNLSGWGTMQPFFERVGGQINTIDSTYLNRVANRAGLHSDHQPFMLAGIPTLTPLGNLRPEVGATYHTNLDRFDKVDKPGMLNTVRFSAMLLYALADEKKLPVKTQNDIQTKDFLIEQGLESELRLGKQWRWQ